MGSVLEKKEIHELNWKLKWKTVLVAFPAVLVKCSKTFQKPRETHQGIVTWMQHALLRGAGQNWPFVSRSTCQGVVKHFPSTVCLAASVDRTSAAAFSMCWHRASPTLVTYCHFHRLSCHTAGSAEMWNVQKLEMGPLLLVTTEEREIQIIIFKCLFGLTHVRIHFNGLIWQSVFPGSKMNRQISLVMIILLFL